MDFTNKVVLITGASSGIGAGTATYLAKLGAKLALTGRNSAKLQKTADDCKKLNGGVAPLMIIANLCIEKDAENVVKKTIEVYKRLDVLVNNAGVMVIGDLATTTLADFDMIFNTNVRVILHLTKLAMPHLIESIGNVVNVSGAVSKRVIPIGLSYSMSKAALDHFTKCVALEMALKNVRVNSVNPGPVLTSIQERSGMIGDTPMDDFLKFLDNIQPNGRRGEIEEVANAIAFLGSDLASNITGTILSVDGGLALK